MRPRRLEREERGECERWRGGGGRGEEEEEEEGLLKEEEGLFKAETGGGGGLIDCQQGMTEGAEGR